MNSEELSVQSLGWGREVAQAALDAAAPAFAVNHEGIVVAIGAGSCAELGVSEGLKVGEPFPLALPLGEAVARTLWGARRLVKAVAYPGGYVVSLRDPVERLLERHREAASLAHIGHWELDLLSGELHWSEEIFRLFNVDQKRFGASYEAFLAAIHPDDREFVHLSYTRSVETRTPYQVEHRIVRGDGKTVWVREQGRTTYDGDGRALRSLGTVLDITSIREAFAAQSLAEQRLAAARKTEALGTLVGGLAHDFNNLLTAILGNSELALDDLSPDHPAAGDIEQVILAARRARDILLQILLYHRTWEHLGSAAQLAEVMEQVAEETRVLLPPGATLHLRLDPTSRSLKLGEGALRTILRHILSNARLALLPGGRITLSAERTHLASPLAEGVPAGQWVVLSVQDDGEGIAEEHIHRIFDPYFTTRPFGRGTGLGLSIVFGLVRSAGGFVTAYSRRGAGTLLRLYLLPDDK